MISVVIPTHNRATLLRRAIDSVLSQTYSDLELIVVSDGSTDETPSVVAEYAKKDSRVRFVELMPGRGGNVARNMGIEASNGEYVAFLDDDDEWLPEKLKKQVSVFNSEPRIGIVYTGVHILYVDEQIEYNSLSREKGDLSKKILFDNCIGTTSTVVIRKELISKTGVFDEKLKALQDYDLWIRFCQVCDVGVVSEEMINYYNYTGTVQVSSATRKYVDAFKVINNKYREYFDSLSEDEKKAKLHNEYILLSNKAMRNGDGRLARQYLKKDLRLKFNKKAIIYYCFSFFSYRNLLKMRSFV